MKVALRVHGGLAAAVNLGRPPRELDTENLAGDAGAELSRLLAAVASEGEESRPGPGGDAMSYTITVEDGDTTTVLTRSDTTMSPAFAALLTWLEKHLAQG
ncbi:protealysin inhibitor emfourin [Streptomyces sp. NPDC002643]